MKAKLVPFLLIICGLSSARAFSRPHAVCSLILGNGIEIDVDERIENDALGVRVVLFSGAPAPISTIRLTDQGNQLQLGVAGWGILTLDAKSMASIRDRRILWSNKIKPKNNWFKLATTSENGKYWIGGFGLKTSTVVSIDKETAKRVDTFRFSEGRYILAAEKSGTSIVTSVEKSNVLFQWHFPCRPPFSPELISSIAGAHGETVLFAEFSEDDTFLATVVSTRNSARELRLYKPGDWSLLVPTKTLPQETELLAAHSLRHAVAVADRKGNLLLYHLDSPEKEPFILDIPKWRKGKIVNEEDPEKSVVVQKKEWVTSLAFTRQGDYLVAGTTLGHLHIYSALTGKEVTRKNTIESHQLDHVTAMQFSNDDSFLYVGDVQGELLKLDFPKLMTPE
jgi:WD40 repeat protein